MSVTQSKQMLYRALDNSSVQLHRPSGHLELKARTYDGVCWDPCQGIRNSPTFMLEAHPSKEAAPRIRSTTSYLSTHRSIQPPQTGPCQGPYSLKRSTAKLGQRWTQGRNFYIGGPGEERMLRILWVDLTAVTSHAQLQAAQRGPRMFSNWCGGSSGSVENNSEASKEELLQKSIDDLFYMDQEGIVPSVDIYRSLLEVCIERKAMDKVKTVLSHFASHRPELSSYLDTDATKCDTLEHAVRTLEKLPRQTVFSWTAMISRFIKARQARIALRLFRCMQEEGVQPDKYTFVALLRACSITRDLDDGKRIHGEVLKSRCEFDTILGTAVVDMYAKCGSVVTAQYVFESLIERDVVAWTVMLGAYVEQGHGERALQIYEEMQVEGVSPNARTLVTTLQACHIAVEKEVMLALDDHKVRPEVLQRGKELHCEAYRRSYQCNVFVRNALVDMYMSCGSMRDAEHVLNGSSLRNVVSWNTLLARCTEDGRAVNVLQLYQRMHEDSVSPDARTFVSVLQALSTLIRADDIPFESAQLEAEHMQKVKILHAEACRRGYWTDAYIGSSLITLYSNMGSILCARFVFDSMVEQDVVVWTAILRAYVQQGQGSFALELYEQMKQDGVSPNSRTFLPLLQACGNLSEHEAVTLVDGQLLKPESLKNGKVINAEAGRRGYADVFLGNTLLSMYAKCGSINDAQNVFHSLLQKDLASWNAMITGYAQQGHGDKALQLYVQAQEEMDGLDSWSMVGAVHACAVLAEVQPTSFRSEHSVSPKILYLGKVMHAEVVRRGYEANIFVANALVDMYTKCGSTLDAQIVFDRMLRRNLVTWNLMLLASSGEMQRLSKIYHQMHEEVVSPDSRTFVTVLQACGDLDEGEDIVMLDGQLVRMKALQRAKAIHAEALRRGHGNDVYVGNALVSMYGKFGSIRDAQNVFFSLPQRSIVSWNAMLAAWSHADEGKRAIELYAQLHEEAVSPNFRTFVSALQACASLIEEENAVCITGQPVKVESIQIVKAIHAEAQRRGCDADNFVRSILICLYGRCGSVMDAHIVFNGSARVDVVLWNAMLATYAKQGQAYDALDLYQQMQEEGIEPDDTTFLAILEACGIAGALDVCEQIHRRVVSGGHALSPRVAQTLIYVYGRCASMMNAQIVFDTIVHPDVVAFTALIVGYARQGNCRTALRCFKQMCAAGVQPNGITFLTILSACCHAGMVTEGVECFESMCRNFGITPEIQHYVTLADLFGRVGYFHMIEELMLVMPLEPDLSMWLCLLGACQKHGNVVLAKLAFNHAVRLQPTCAAAYISMSNILTRAGMRDDARQVDGVRRRASAWKEPGRSWIQCDRKSVAFLAGDWTDPQQEEVHQLLERLVY